MPRTVSTWAKSYVRGAAEAQFNCTVRIFPNGTPTLNATTGAYSAAEGVETYNGPARIWSADGGVTMNLGEGDYATTTTYCSIPWDATPVPENDNQIEVMACPGDPNLVGKVFRVMSVDGGGQMRATRRMQVTALAKNRSWQP